MLIEILKDGLVPMDYSFNSVIANEVKIRITLPKEATFRISDNLYTSQIGAVVNNDLQSIGAWIKSLTPEGATEYTSTIHSFLQEVADVILAGKPAGLIYTRGFNQYIRDTELGGLVTTVVLEPVLTPFYIHEGIV